MISLHFQGKPFNITGIQVYALTSNAEEAEADKSCEDLHDILHLSLLTLLKPLQHNNFNHFIYLKPSHSLHLSQKHATP